LKGSFEKVKKIWYLLKKSLYELKQPLRQWYKQFNSFIIKAYYTRCESDRCVYLKQCNDFTYLVLYVDNMLISVRNKTYIHKVKTQLKEFNMKDLKEVKKTLDMEISQDTNTGRLRLYQEHYVLKMLENSTWLKQDRSLLL